MKRLTEKRAEELRARGITHIASIVKSHFNTEYFKYASLEDILANEGRMPAYPKYNGFIHGISQRRIDWQHTIRWSAI